MIHAIVRRATVSTTGAGGHPSITKIIAAFSCMLVFISVLKRSTNALERIVMILTSVFFFLWALGMLSAYGCKWASVPYNLMISAAISAFAAALVGLRAFQVNAEGRHHPK